MTVPCLKHSCTIHSRNNPAKLRPANPGDSQTLALGHAIGQLLGTFLLPESDVNEEAGQYRSGQVSRRMSQVGARTTIRVALTTSAQCDDPSRK